MARAGGGCRFDAADIRPRVGQPIGQPLGILLGEAAGHQSPAFNEVLGFAQADNGYYCKTEGCPQPPLKRVHADGAALAYFENLGFDRESTLRAIQAQSERYLTATQAVLDGAQKARMILAETNARLWTDRVEGRFDDDDWHRWKASTRSSQRISTGRSSSTRRT